MTVLTGDHLLHLSVSRKHDLSSLVDPWIRCARVFSSLSTTEKRHLLHVWRQRSFPVIGSPGCSNSLKVQINQETARPPLNDEYCYDFDQVSDKYIQNSSTNPVLEVV